MFGSNVLEIAIGMLLIYSILSLICSALTELFAEQLLSLRSRKLNKWIRTALESDGADFVDRIFDHALIRTLTKGPSVAKPKNLPCYIPAKTFALALFDVATTCNQSEAGGAAEAPARIKTIDDFVAAVDKIKEPNVKWLLQSLSLDIYSASNNKAQQLQAAWMNIETWFDNVMEQATTEYKRNLRWITLVIAFGFTWFINADSLMLVNALANDPAVRSLVLAEAGQFVDSPPATLETGQAADAPNGQRQTIEELQQDLDALGLFGWAQAIPERDDRRAPPDDIGGWLYKLLGFAVTVFAISLGAPFWFDLLNKLVNLRAAGAKPPKAAEQEEIVADKDTRSDTYK